jgi:hypothetical protein
LPGQKDFSIRAFFDRLLERSCALIDRFSQKQYGETLVVEQMPPELHERIDPKSELVERVHPDKIVDAGEVIRRKKGEE